MTDVKPKFEAGYEVNDATMDHIRAAYSVLDGFIKNPANSGSAVKAEAWEAFQEIRQLRLRVAALTDVLVVANEHLMAHDETCHAIGKIATAIHKIGGR